MRFLRKHDFFLDRKGGHKGDSKVKIESAKNSKVSVLDLVQLEDNLEVILYF